MKNLRTAFTLLMSTILFGVGGYYFLEGMSLFDSFYMTIITISTVGFNEVKTLSTQGRIVTILIISIGITIGAYTIGTFLRMLIEGELKKSFGRRKVENQIARLKNHTIICGYGRIGRLIGNELKSHKKDCVIVENDPVAIEQLDKDRMLYLPLDATSDDSLLKAGIVNATSIVTALRSDADNVFITLTAKGLKPGIFVLSRSSDEKNEVKLLRAGADQVVSPYLIGGKRMAQVLIRPTVVDFIDIAFTESNLGLIMEEFRIEAGSNLVGKNLMESNLRKNYGIIIVLIKKCTGEMIFNPGSLEIIEADDVLVVLGMKDDLMRLSEEV